MTQPPPDTRRLEHRAALAAVIVGVALLAIKFVAWTLTGSAAIFSDAVESIVNVVASLIALAAIRIAHTPADREHPYGHGKVEFVSAGVEGVMICVAALVIAATTLDLLLTRSFSFERTGWGLLLMASTILVNGVTGWALLRVGRRTGSLALQADGKHLFADSATTAVAIAGLAIVHFTGWPWADPIAALLIAAWIGWVGAGLVRQAMLGLLDTQDERDARLIESILSAHLGPAGREPLICSYHKVRHRHTGRYHWIDLHIRVKPDLDVRRAHDIASAIEHEIEEALGEGDATAHVEPCDASACAVCGGTGPRTSTKAR